MPRVYRKGFPLISLFKLTGSALPRSVLPGLIAAGITFSVSYWVPRDYLDNLLLHPYPLQPFAYIAAFALVFRTQVAYNRYWEAATDTAMMASKWGDAIVECLGFDEFPRNEEDAVALERRRHFQVLIIQRFSLMHALALQYLRRDEDLNLLCRASASDDSFPLTDTGVHTSSRLNESWRRLPVLGGVTEGEVALLEPTPDRVAFAFSQALALINGRRADGACACYR